MPKTKYFEAIQAAQSRDSLHPANALPPFDFETIAPGGFSAKFKNALFQKIIGPAYAFSRAFFPIAKVGGFYHITRDEQVRDVLLRPETFTVPFGPEMKEIAGGVIFALGIDGVEQARQNALVRKVIRPDEDIELVTSLTRRFATALIENSGGKIDAINELFKRTVTEACARYFGLTIADPDKFADAMMACSALLFGDPYGDETIRRVALSGAAHLRMTLDGSVSRIRVMQARAPSSDTPPITADTIIERLLTLQSAQAQTDPISDDEIRAILFGLLTGFVPTNTLASGKILDELLRRPAAFSSAVAAARLGKDGREQLKRILLEAGRFNPAISPGVWRYSAAESEIMVGSKAKTIPAGSLLLVSTMSAMRDKRAIPFPGRFWPDRVDKDGQRVEPELMFGVGTHWCLGKYLAIEQIAEVFTALLRQDGIRPAKGKAGKLQSIGPFPRSLQMEYDTPATMQSMFIVLSPVTSGATKYAIDALLKPYGNPVRTDVQAALDATGIVHFTSMATIMSESRLDVAWELTVDGELDVALEALARHAGSILRPVFEQCGLMPGENIAAFWKRHVVHLHGKPWGANGLNYNGLPEFPIATTEKQTRFADFAERALNNFVASESVRGSHAMLALDHVKRIIGQDPVLKKGGTSAQRTLMAEAAAQGFDAFQLKPSARSLKLGDFRTMSVFASFAAFIKSRDGLIVTLPVVACFTLFYLLFLTNIPSPGYVWKWVGTGLKALLASAFLITATIAGFFLLIRRAEKKDWIDPSQAPMAHLAAINAQENAPGYVQNHILAVGEMKPGFLRAFAHAFALWAIRIIVTFNYRPGFVINMGTIHFARWWRVPGTNKTAFYSNFDGSWENYLEDFITRARWGQSAAWSNWKGFPETHFLAFKGAGQGDDFKRWVRTKQQIVPCWYSRFPALTTDRIRTNALIHHGLAHARTNNEAEEWLRCFGSMPRVENLIESDEVQALVFSGLKQLQHSATIVLKLPKGALLGEWLSWVRGERQSLDHPADAENSAMTGGLAGSGVIVPTYATDGTVEGYSLAHSLTLTFGDRPLVGDASIYDVPPVALDATDDAANDANDPQRFGKADAGRAARRAVFLGLSAKGLASFSNASSDSDAGLLAQFPSAFRMGMAARGRSLGDFGKEAADTWRWSDATAEAVLFVYAETPEDLAFACDVHQALAENYGGEALHRLICGPANPEKPDFEHFGYRDGLAQPVIKGTGRATRGAPERDMVEPGEFLLGYANGQGFYPPTPVVGPDQDPMRTLPVLSPDMLSRYPDFGDRKFGEAARDLGRNGSFIVIRELSQDVEGFEGFVKEKADELRGEPDGENGPHYRDLYKLIGQYPDQDWVKAKLMGRWPSGRPLVGNPVNTPSPKPSDPDAAKCFAAETENDFTYGADDPHGYACPFAAHIRRTNPRDSKQPGDPKEQAITNRHRLLRRGRAYVRPGADGHTEKGLLFVSLCADIERQFEFVQQVWTNSADFHGLANEPDPIIGSDVTDLRTGCPADRNFTIPTPAGPIKLRNMQSFVQVKAGGYFFLPSRSALTWLTVDAQLPKKTSVTSV
jgi:cytochrome P450/deferrochelatase/peroxidase EfeB